jgi:ABC-type polysaccharide/polyol phosphate transport system ATPase subunit
MPVDSSATQPFVRIEAVSKQYQLGELSSLRRMLLGLTRRAGVRGSHGFSALDNVNLEVFGGQAVALVGHNGSGKSTLLHTICGITLPSDGRITVRGRVLPLFAVGASFHGELTGRENIVLFGTILGLSRAAIAAQTDAIVEFSELEGHLDTPVKRYSDGMKARLSFAIAIRFPAEVYIFDEVLAVVDNAFRDRCLEAIEKLRDAGKLILFVSHDVAQVERVCTHAAWFEHGRIRAFGPSDEIVPQYELERAEHNRHLAAADVIMG